jgi:hypothetical protein
MLVVVNDAVKGQTEYLEKIRKAEMLVAKVMQVHPGFDRHDLFHIALKQFDTPEAKWASGIRRRLISNVFSDS